MAQKAQKKTVKLQPVRPPAPARNRRQRVDHAIQALNLVPIQEGLESLSRRLDSFERNQIRDNGCAVGQGPPPQPMNTCASQSPPLLTLADRISNNQGNFESYSKFNDDRVGDIMRGIEEIGGRLTSLEAFTGLNRR